MAPAQEREPGKVARPCPGHRLHREQGIKFLWPESGKKAASNSLRRVLHVARRIFDPAAGSRYLASEDESLVLCPEGDLWLDVGAFEEAASTARRSRDPAAYSRHIVPGLLSRRRVLPCATNIC